MKMRLHVIFEVNLETAGNIYMSENDTNESNLAKAAFTPPSATRFQGTASSEESDQMRTWASAFKTLMFTGSFTSL